MVNEMTLTDLQKQILNILDTKDGDHMTLKQIADSIGCSTQKIGCSLKKGGMTSSLVRCYYNTKIRKEVYYKHTDETLKDYKKMIKDSFS